MMGRHAALCALPLTALLDAASSSRPPVTFVAVDAGTAFTCAIASDGAAYCWGVNRRGQLGLGAPDTLAHPAPAPVGSGRRYTAISAGAAHVCAIAADSTAWCWGSNSHGQLGDGRSGEDAMSPTPVAVTGGLRFRTISAGFRHTCAVTTSDAAYCWGDDRYGKLGDGDASTPVGTPSPVAGGLALRYVSVGGAHSCALTMRGAPYCWGDNNQGQLGTSLPHVDCLVNASVFATERCRGRPTPVDSARAFAEISTGGWHTCAVTAAGAVSCWGLSGSGQLGAADSTPCRVNVPAVDAAVRLSCRASAAPIASGRRFRVLTAGEQFTCALGADSTASCWGANYAGQLGRGDPRLPRSAEAAPVSGGLRFVSLRAGGSHVCGLTADGAIFCWGSSLRGEIGAAPTHTCRVEPAEFAETRPFACAAAPVRVGDPG